jgi:predicted ATPase
MEESQIIADRIRAAELELQFAHLAFDGSPRSQDRYTHALAELDIAQRLAMRHERLTRALHQVDRALPQG